MIELICPDYELSYKTRLSVGLDVQSTESYLLRPGEITLVKTGIWINQIETHSLSDPVPYLQLSLRSSIGAQGIIQPNAPGIIDIDYPDEILLQMLWLPPPNSGAIAYRIDAGDRVGQLTYQRGYRLTGVPIYDTVRTGGHGSTGKD